MLGEESWRDSDFEIRRFGRRLCEVRLPLPGEHNVLNALAAAALAYENGLSADQISAGLASFPGLHRRLELLGTWRGATLIDDYAHHPTEVAAALGGRSAACSPTRGCGASFSRIRRREPRGCWTNWPQACKMPTRCWWPRFSGHGRAIPSRGRSRRPISPGGPPSSASRSCRAIPPEEIVETLETQLAPGDVLVTLGAGDTEKLRPR